MPKIVPKLSKSILNKFWRYFFRKTFFAQCSMEGRVFEMLLRKFKIPKTYKIVPKLSKSVLKMSWDTFLEKLFLRSVRWKVECSKGFQKIKKMSKLQKRPKSFPNCPKAFWTCFGVLFEKFFLPSVPWRVETSKCFQKKNKFSKLQKSLNRSQKCPNVFWTCFGLIFSKKKFPQCSMEGRVFEMFSKNQKSFKLSRMPKIVPKSVQTCFEQVLG